LLFRGRLQYVREVQSAEEFLRALDPVERGRVISVLRSARGLTRDQLAKDAKVSPNTISDWERGKVSNPRELFAKLAPVLDLSLANIRYALSLVKAQRTSGSEVAEAPESPYESAMVDDRGLLPLSDIQAMSWAEIEREIGLIYLQIGRLDTRIHLLHAELAARSAVRSTG
jgi:transcriptional regulator with XRE-family HTH domain